MICKLLPRICLYSQTHPFTGNHPDKFSYQQKTLPTQKPFEYPQGMKKNPLLDVKAEIPLISKKSIKQELQKPETQSRGALVRERYHLKVMSLFLLKNTRS